LERSHYCFMKLNGKLREVSTKPYDFVDDKGQRRTGESRSMFIDDETSGIPVISTLVKVSIPKGVNLPELSVGEEVELEVYFAGGRLQLIN